MLKRALRALFLLPALLLPGAAFAAGTITFSMQQQLDQYGKPLSGCQLYTYQAGTTATPQNAYQDTALTLPLPNPMSCDSSGRLPQFFLADGLIKIRLADKNGNQQLVLDNVLVIGPSSGGGGGGSIDPTTIAATGDVKAAYGTGTLTGWVRMNGRTIGSATSGATERANSDVQALFQYLWSADPNLAVSGGRGGSSAADWAANKTIALPDARGRAIAGLDDMGNAASGRLTAALFGSTGGCSSSSPTTLGTACGSESLILGTPNLPPYTPAGTITNGTISVSNGANFNLGNGSGATAAPSAGNTFVISNTLLGSMTFAQGTTTFAGAAQGGTSTPFSPSQPTILTTFYIKL
jgi:hypothetical protein